MLTVDFDRLGIGPGTRVIDVGCGAGRHAFEAYRRGADVVAFDRDEPALAEVETMFAAMAAEGEAPEGARATTVAGDALALPYPEASFDCVIASEILEHVPEDERAIAELVRVTRPGGTVAVTVPRWLPERVCWLLSDAYHQVEGGHVRIYRGDELRTKLRAAGLRPVAGEHAHALHSPYWWLKCAVGTDNDDHPLVKAYHRVLVWDLLHAPWPTRLAERVLDPVLGKSLAVYSVKDPPAPSTRERGRNAAEGGEVAVAAD
ncbi:class I SAM-dependent methyltransferase [Prauserella rugosa]|uniref:Methyltransferase family protein n=1 Tax=Prauserella rugosa TaxID=43354 RepID=A0A660CGF6_9PSEU|nr:methyltransferase domain-containing protein [Prauserella rugosa]KID30614.1 methyltransferase family protein [Prauserella sp. Am3]TWH20091.1 methyltransferase family protein [Prauserella rugosa]